MLSCCDRIDWAWKVKVAAIKDCPGVVTTASANGDLSYTIPTGVLMLSQDGGIAGVFNTFYVTESSGGRITMTPNSRYRTFSAHQFSSTDASPSSNLSL